LKRDREKNDELIIENNHDMFILTCIEYKYDEQKSKMHIKWLMTLDLHLNIDLFLLLLFEKEKSLEATKKFAKKQMSVNEKKQKNE
jgi:hypothetical protein